MSTGPMPSLASPATSVPAPSIALVADHFSKSNLYSSQAFDLAFDAIADIQDTVEEVEYDTLITWLVDAITNGGTGLTTASQQDLWGLETERDALALADAKDRKVQDWARGGWPLPDGVLEASLAEIDREYLNKRLDKSREIRVRGEELEIANVRFAVQRYTELVAAHLSVAEKAQGDIAQAAANLAAGALAAAHAQASVGFSSSYGVDNNISASTSASFSHNTSYDADA